ncbi:uncharacterized protein PHACADRAFT_252161 [Phanerochaete carnosa HHB-10118-sp]|uniref:Chromo domain-containing protein n=1 Tax=Phanerochaete carnosa (strain HHB-10118-sp) TaxID=650164 RepID=K5WFN2_PHACS|nr:uncharacterized protein PHACADRAFT_252161 [Phanerochaete carnosa HHB-10118-sp]EKM58115.1 hypothetical protein PHACADRAFT_252161 [Phanerochaete carnosa HHB-10118-sp]
MWLFKWMNYEASQCTWEDSSKLPTNCDRFIAEFERTARAEGFVVGDPMGYIVLQEGARAGWRRPGWY